MSFITRYSTDKTSEEDGQWVEFGDGVEVKVRRINSTKSKELRRKLEKPYTKQFRGADLPDDIQEMLLNKQVSMAIVADWKGIPNNAVDSSADGKKDLPCTEENVMAVIKAFPDFRDDVVGASLERATFQKQELEDAEKNS